MALTNTEDRPHVLVVDDEVHNLELLERVLRPEFRVHVATSGAAALRILASTEVSVIITDHRMPVMTGPEFLRQSLAYRPRCKRLLLTGYADVEAIASAVNDGKISHFIQKPFDSSALRVTVRQLTAMARLEQQNEELFEELKTMNGELAEKERWLATSLNERERELLRALDDLATKNSMLQELVLRDGLTGLYNHRSFQQRLREEVARTARQGGSLSLVLCDIDHFKTYNDRFGHPTGDELLREVAGVLGGTRPGAPHARKSDIVCRYGGEEFAIILCDTDKDGAVIRAERLRQSFSSTPIKPDPTNGPVSAPPSSARGPRSSREPRSGNGRDGAEAPEFITLSFGLASLPQDGREAEELIRYADMALFRSKQAGRDRVTAWSFASERPRPMVRNFHDARMELAAAFVRERFLSVVTVQLPDLPNIEARLTPALAVHACDVLLEAVVDLTDALVPGDELLAITAPQPGTLELFLVPPKDREHARPSYLEKVCATIAERVERRLRGEARLSVVGILRVVAGHSAQLVGRASSPERQLDELRQSATVQAAAEWVRRRAQDKFELQRVILNGLIRRAMQPIFGQDRGAPIGYEALARGPKGPMESPLVLLDLAEDVGLVAELDVAMLMVALRRCAKLGAAQLFVNVLPTTLADTAFVQQELPALVAAAGLGNERVVLELSERMSLDHSHAFLATLDQLRTAGFRLALDDFGTRNANLTEIAAFRPEWVKLDRGLVQGIDADHVKQDLVRAVVDFGRRQGSHVLAEGIETEEELAALKEIGVEFFQGYLLGRPALIDDEVIEG